MAKLQRVGALVIGASAGGIRAMIHLLSALPARWTIPIIAVIHMPEQHDSRLAEVFQHYVPIHVAHAQDKQEIHSGHLYFAPPGYHLSIEPDYRFSLSCEDPVHFSRPSIDFLMASAADAYGPALVGILLTGANQDGAEGLARIKAAGGITIVQDPREAEIAVMPQAAIDYFAPDHILTLSEIRTFILTLENA